MTTGSKLFVLMSLALWAQALLAQKTDIHFLKEVETSRCFHLGELQDSYFTRTKLTESQDLISVSYPYIERIDMLIFFANGDGSKIEERSYSRSENQIETIKIRESQGNEATLRRQIQSFINLKKVFSCKEVAL